MGMPSAQPKKVEVRFPYLPPCPLYLSPFFIHHVLCPFRLAQKEKRPDPTIRGKTNRIATEDDKEQDKVRLLTLLTLLTVLTLLTLLTLTTSTKPAHLTAPTHPKDSDFDEDLDMDDDQE
jgi:hypothetical protein